MRFMWALASAGISLTCAQNTSSSRCPAGYAPNADRTARLVAALHDDAETRAALEPRTANFTACFAPGGAGVLSDGRLLLDADADERTTTARAAHLLHHLRAGAVVTSGHAKAADEREARALEARVLARKR